MALALILLTHRTDKYSIYRDAVYIDGVYIPTDLNDCFAELRKTLEPDLLDEMMSRTEKEMVRYHMGVGLWMRNSWGLWRRSRLARNFNNLGIYHPDDMSGIVLISFWRHLHDEPIRLEEQVKHYQEYWKNPEQSLQRAEGHVEDRRDDPARSTPEKGSGQLAEFPALMPPVWWNSNDPLPVEKTNCVRCHLTAGRELTVPVRDFARSVHDRVGLSCNDCHGGNTEDDAKAHEAEFGFIGTKLSAHMAGCAECHVEEAEAFRKGPHFWDLTKRINRDYPVCIDCHGNHDVGRPPDEFSLTAVCTECHKQFAEDQPTLASVVAENDRLWKTLRRVHAKNRTATDPTPAPFHRQMAAVRYATARLAHPAAQVKHEQADLLNKRVRSLREGLETWLKEQE